MAFGQMVSKGIGGGGKWYKSFIVERRLGMEEVVQKAVNYGSQRASEEAGTRM